MPITERQEKVLEYVRTRLESGACPSIREIMDEFGWSSTSAVQHHLNRLKAAGLLDRTPRVSRGLAIPGAVYVPTGATVIGVDDTGQEIAVRFVALATVAA